jgi:integrase
LSRLALEALERARTRSGGIGDAWVFPSPRTPEKPLSRRALDRWLALAQRQAGLDPLGWHSLRRKFATELTEIPLKDLCTLGGWKDPTTVLSCYQVPDLERMRRSLEARRPLGTRGAMRQTNRQS